jgi:DNA-3-methyladenine glycosylase II
MTVAAAVRRRIARDLGTRHEVAGVELAAFPAPEVLLAVRQIEGVDERRLERLHAVARAARSGVLDGSRLRDADTDAARAALLGIPGIGPFSAELVLIRGAGAPDVFPSAEPRLHAEMGRAYGIDPGDVDRLTAVADGWRPFRSWVSFLFRRRAEDRSVRPDA